MADGREGLGPGVLLALVVVLCVMLCTCCLDFRGARNGREGFEITPRARKMARESKEVFKRGRPTFQQFKKKVAGGDPVNFDEISALHRAGRLTPAEVQSMLDAE